MKQPTSTSCGRSSSKEDVFLTESPQVKKSLQQETTTNKTVQHNKDHDREATATDEFVNELTLSFPVAINIDDIATSTVSCMSSSVNAQSTTRSSISNAIERNKSLATTTTVSRLTVAEEDRLSKLLAQDDDENYKDATSTREVELDSLLNGLGYNIETEEEGKDDDKERGDPVLRKLAKERTLEKQKQKIDQALRTLLREPLPPVVRDDDASLQLQPSDHDTILTAPLTEDDIQVLIEKAKNELYADKFDLADQQSIRLLAQSIVDEESSKRSST